MKAWHTFVKHETGEDALHAVVFAETRGKAKYYSDAYGEVEWNDIGVKRVPEFDQYAKEGKIPRKAMVEAGWTFDCDGCKGSLNASNYHEDKILCDYCFEEVTHETSR